MDDVEGFDELAPAPRLYESRQWFRYCERTADGEMRYLSARDDAGRPLGLSTARIVRSRHIMGLYDPGSVLGDWRPVDLYPSLVGAVSGAHSVLLTRSGDHEADVRAVLAEGFADLAAKEGCDAFGMLYLDRHEDAVDVSRAWNASAPLAFSAQTLLTGEWSDFDGYVATLKKSRRNKVRRERREYDASGIRTSIWHGTDKLDERTAKLQLAVRDKYGVGGSIESITRDYENLSLTVEDHVLVFLAEIDHEPVGMCLALLDGDRLHLRLVGFDYDKADDFLYFNILFYEPIRWGIAHGITSYMFGTGSYSAKLARGCRPKPLYAVNRWPESDHAECEKRASEHADTLNAQLTGISGGTE